ncbi:hypothetical protein RRG08_062673 [Elysia crispata]|uniref:Uncharacterized protein n=1 Tax=Elysia crispata TaxID=231223 RepID=A0AAE0XML0_9GAST|nr:hypothetical protein RRG08_062673 [Elysia crispata]
MKTKDIPNQGWSGHWTERTEGPGHGITDLRAGPVRVKGQSYRISPQNETNTVSNQCDYPSRTSKGSTILNLGYPRPNTDSPPG